MNSHRILLCIATIAVEAPTLAQGALPQRINDSGQTTCYAGGIPTDSGVSVAACSNTTWPDQDGAGGRDAAGSALPKTGAGDAGFDFTKLSNAGLDLPASAAAGAAPGDWGCTRDNVTGLVWRIAETANLSWGGAQALARETNAAGGACGFDDWRLPGADEIEGIIDFGKSSPALDTTYFPAPASSFHWTSEFDPGAPARRARVVNFDGGFVHAIEASAPASAMLVRGGQFFGTRTDNGDGTSSIRARGSCGTAVRSARTRRAPAPAVRPSAIGKMRSSRRARGMRRTGAATTTGACPT